MNASQVLRSPQPFGSPPGVASPSTVPTTSLTTTLASQVPWWVWAGGGVLALGAALVLWQTYLAQKRLKETLERDVLPVLLESQAPGSGRSVVRARAASARDGRHRRGRKK